jgi:anti-sigma factor RsiW
MKTLISCRDLSERAGDLIDGKLSVVERLKVHAHLLACVHCRRYVAQLQATLTAVKSRNWASASPESTERVIGVFRASAGTANDS